VSLAMRGCSRSVRLLRPVDLERLAASSDPVGLLTHTASCTSHDALETLALHLALRTMH